MRLKSTFPVVLLCSFVLLLPCCISTSFPVYIIFKLRFETAKSTALRWVTANENTTDFNDGVVGGYELGYDNTTKRPIYICRARQGKFLIPGYVRPSNRKCIIITSDVELHQMNQYQVLENTENIANLDWVDKGRYTMSVLGSVLGAFDPKTYISRVTLRKPSRLTYIPGYLEPSVNFGRYTFVTERNELVQTEYAQLLVEKLAIGYEMRNIRFEDEEVTPPTQEEILATGVLRNGGIRKEKIEGRIEYNYTYNVNWGFNHGLTVGLPLHVYEKNGTADIYYWGKDETICEDGSNEVERVLAPGTAVNITVLMKYVVGNTPYTATLVLLYKENEKRQLTIKDRLKRIKVIDITISYGPVYYLHNNRPIETNPDEDDICSLAKRDDGASSLHFPSIGFVLSMIVLTLRQLQ